MDAYYVKAIACLSAAIAMGLGSIGPALGQGLIGMKACENIGKFPKSFKEIRFLMIMGMSMVETSAIYCLIIALACIFYVS